MDYFPETEFDPGTGRPVHPDMEPIDPGRVPVSTPEPENTAPNAPLKQLNDRHRRVAQLEVAGFSLADIARDVGYSAAWVSQLRKNPTYRIYLSELRRRVEENAIVDIDKRLQHMTEDTLHTIYDLMMNSENEKTRLRAARELFSRQKPPVNKVEADTKHTFYLDGESLKGTLNTMAECLGLPQGEIHDLKPTEVMDKMEKLLEQNDDEENKTHH